AGLLAVTSADRLIKGWQAVERARRAGRGDARSHIEDLLAPLAPNAHIVTVVDAHPAALSWLGAVAGHRVHPLGVDHFGQSGTIPDLYAHHGIDTETIVAACTAARETLARAPSPAMTPSSPARATAVRSAAPESPAQVHAELEIGAAALLDTIEMLDAAAGPSQPIAMHHLLLRIAARTLRELPALAEATGRSKMGKADAAVSLAVYGAGGPVAVNVGDVATTRTADIAAHVEDLVTRAASGTLQPASKRPAALCVIDTASHGARVDAATLSSAAPAILTAGAVDDSGLMRCRLSVDASMIDQPAAAEWLQQFKMLAEDPRRLLL
ncbi:MAG: 2-oxo acid dehydrogenase subunit E2, partial [Gammaproteobacteria bacterium]|nr:2-oxo acid dehydrogenase subunit E2 [Gammaproteobacteria bacterium]